MSDIIDEACKALDGVTPGPWKAERASSGAFDVFDHRGRDVVTVYGGGVEIEDRPNNAYFIAWARKGVPAMIAEIERLREALRLIAEAEGTWQANEASAALEAKP